MGPRARRRVTPEAFLYVVTVRLFLQNKVGRIYVHMFKRVFDSTTIPLPLHIQQARVE